MAAAIAAMCFMRIPLVLWIVGRIAGIMGATAEPLRANLDSDFRDPDDRRRMAWLAAQSALFAQNDFQAGWRLCADGGGHRRGIDRDLERADREISRRAAGSDGTAHHRRGDWRHCWPHPHHRFARGPVAAVREDR